MNAKVSPFKGLELYEAKLKRSELYEDILKHLKNEAYDDSPIGHEFVMGYEKQAPGIITAVVGDHSFLNSDDETNRRIVMEAVSSGLALKAGIVAAVLMIIYKIIRVVTNNKSFGDGGGSGGRGTVPYVTAKQEELVTVAEELKSALKEAKDAVNIVKGNAVARDETSPQFEAATKVASSYRVYVQDADKNLTEKTPSQTSGMKAPKSDPDDPIKVIESMDIGAIGFQDLPAFMMVKDKGEFLEAMEQMKHVVKALNQYEPAKLADMVEQVTAHLRMPKDSEFLLSERYNSLINGIMSRITTALGMDPNTNFQNISRLEIAPELKEQYDIMLRSSYGKLMEDKSTEMVQLADFIVDYVNPNGEFAERSLLVADFNTSFLKFLGNNKELEDSRYYSSLQIYSGNLTEYKQLIKESAEVTNKDEIIKRLDVLISIIEVYTKFLLATICLFRKETDKIDRFRENNIDKMKKLAKALTDFANTARGETT